MDEFDFIVNEPAARYHKASEGITKSDFLSIVAMTGMNLTEFSSLLPASKRTIEKVKDQELLSPQVSDRVLQIGTLFSYGTDVFEDTTSFQAWLHTSLIALGGKKPIDFMNNDTGISIIRDLLGRIEHGVYS
ncbi:MAG: DUF2384 domain-containing protein [Cyclobacteriaceae bacterium]